MAAGPSPQAWLGPFSETQRDLPRVRKPAHTGSMAAVDPLPSGVLRRISDVLGDTDTGLSGREIAAVLYEARIDDPGEITKRHRLFEAFQSRQAKDGAANAVLACIK